MTDEVLKQYDKIMSKRKWHNMCSLRWQLISQEEKLSEEFIEKFQDKVDWEWISFFQKLSEEFIEKFQDKLSLTGLLHNENIIIINKIIDSNY